MYLVRLIDIVLNSVILYKYTLKTIVKESKKMEIVIYYSSEYFVLKKLNQQCYKNCFFLSFDWLNI